MASSKKTGSDAIVTSHYPRLSQEGRALHERARILAEQCAASVPLDYKLELTLFCEYPEGFDELLDACGEEDAGQRYNEIFEEIKKEHPEMAFVFDSVVGERLAALMLTYALFADALHNRQQRDEEQVSAETLTRALLQTDGKFQSAHDRALAILKMLP